MSSDPLIEGLTDSDQARQLQPGLPRLLIACTSRAVAQQLAKLCASQGCEPVIWDQAEGVLTELVRGRYAAFFVEVGFLEARATPLIKEIHGNAALKNLFVAAYGPTGAGLQQSGLFDGANAILQTPFSQLQIAELLRRALALPPRLLLVSSQDHGSFKLALSRMGYEVQQISCLSHDEDSLQRPDLMIREYEQKRAQQDEPVEVRDKLAGVPTLVAYTGRHAEDIESILKHHAGEVILSPFNSAPNLKKIQDLCPLPPKGRRLRALVVDDSATIRGLIVSMFREMGYLVQTATNGFEGYKEVARFRPDIITSDYDMPILNGWQFCSELRDHDSYRNIPIIMITTRATDLDLRKGELLGVSAYLTKPFTRDQLRQTIDAAVHNARLRKEQELIAKFVAADTLKAVNDMVSEEGIQEGRDKFITVLFSDICAFSSKCERFSARKIVKLLNQYFDLMVEVLSQHEAIIDKFIGDAIVARFDSGDRARDALNAVRAGWQMQERLRQFNLEAFEEVRIRVGINSGQVILGNLGSHRHRLEYAMIGDNVNIGQRLESAAPPDRCLISQATFELVQDHVQVGQRQEIQVKGKSEPVVAYVVESVLV
jgi:adenylate cyclase